MNGAAPSPERIQVMQVLMVSLAMFGLSQDRNTLGKGAKVEAEDRAADISEVETEKVKEEGKETLLMSNMDSMLMSSTTQNGKRTIMQC